MQNGSRESSGFRWQCQGTFDRHPDLQIILGHWGEVLVHFLERADALSDRGAAYLDRRVAEYVTGNVLVSAGGIYSHRMLQQTLAMVGADRVFFAADYPYQRTPDGGARRFLVEARISPEDRNRIAYRNAERLLGIPKLASGGSVEQQATS